MLKNFFHMLADEELSQIHGASLEVLEKTGLHIDHPVALEKLAGAGARVDKARRKVYLPKDLVDKALKMAPKSFTCAGRTPEFDFLTGKTGLSQMPSFRTVGGAINLYNLGTSKLTPVSIADCGDMAHLVDGMENLNILGALTARDIQLETYDIETLKVMLERGRKHIWALTTDSKNLKYQIEMMKAVAGDGSRLSKRPICSGIVCLIAPLYFPFDEIERLLMYGEYNIPVRVPLVPIIGANAPYTLAGTITQTNAEALGSLVVLQTLCPGIPTWYYCLVQSMEMSHGGAEFLNPEVMLVESALMQLARFYDLPGASSPVMGNDSQAHQIMFERGTSLTMAALSGINEAGGMGGIENGLTTSPQVVVIDNEIISYIKRLVKGIEISKDTIAAEVIHGDDHKGKYLENPHTFKHLRKEARFKPSLFDWSSLLEWQKDQKTIIDRAEDKRVEIMNHHVVPPLEEKLTAELDRILKTGKKELAGC
ncbi:trimethylamine methyltransferase family protein [Desulfobacula sp.]